MAETSLPWDGTTTGDATAAPYDFATEIATVLNALCGGSGTSGGGGVVRDALNEYLATTGANQVTIGSGIGVAYGTVHSNSANLDFTVATPASSTRVDRIVLRKDWVAQTVRLHQIAGVEGAGAPALVQSAGTTWDVPLWRASITTGGVITLTDDRIMVPVHGDQSSETGTKHDYADIANAPAASSTVADSTVGTPGTAGVATTYSKGDHAHEVTLGEAVAGPTSILNTSTDADSELTLALPDAGIYRFSVTCAFQLNTATEFVASVTYSGTQTDLHQTIVGPGVTDYLQAQVLFDSNGPFGEVGAGVANMGVIIEGYIVATSAGDLALSFGGNGTGAVYRLAGGFIHAIRFA